MKVSPRGYVLLFFYLITSAWVLLIFIVRPGIEGHPGVSYPEMVYGKAKKPYVCRALFPASVRVISSLTPEVIKKAVNAEFEEKRMVRILDWKRQFAYEYLVGLVLMLACLVGFAFTLRYLVGFFYDYSPLVADMAPLGCLLIIPLFYRYYSYLYDPANLLIFTLALALIVTRRRLWLFLVFILATFNKETSILLAALFFLHEFKGRFDMKILGNTFILLFIWAAGRWVLAYLFRDNPGTFVELHLLDHNIHVPAEHLLSLVYFVGMVLLCTLVVRRGWEGKPHFLRRGLVATFFPLFILHLLFGYVDELRGYYEALPFVFLLALPTVIDWLSVPEPVGSK